MEAIQKYEKQVIKILEENNIQHFIILKSNPLYVGEYIVAPISISWIEDGKLQGHIENLIIKNEGE